MIDPTKLLAQLREREIDLAMGLLKQPPETYDGVMKVVGQGIEVASMIETVREWFHMEDDKE